MKLEEAIDRNIELMAELAREGRMEKYYSVRLGIEAMKRLQVFREYDAYGHRVLLPGETKD